IDVDFNNMVQDWNRGVNRRRNGSPFTPITMNIMDMITSMVAEKPVVIFSKSTCCLSHSMTSLIRSFGANPTVHELDEMANGQQIESALLQMGCQPSVPAVFIGQRFVAMDVVTTLTAEKPVVIFSKSNCCMGHTVKALISSFGTEPAVFELDKMPSGHQVERALLQLGCCPSVPAVFIGQKFIGGADEVIKLNVQNKLAQLLLGARAIFIWS
ncbi:Monothiol glutaredoxin-S6, partial [Mucuna pruriens]